MGPDAERKDEREINVSVEISTGAFLPGGKIAFAYKRAWQHRADRYLEAVTVAAKAEESQIIDAVAQGEGFSDLFASGLQIITAQSDEAYRNTFASFVAEALRDPAKVDVSSFLLEKFGRLRPPHIRVFWTICLRIIRAEREEECRREEEARRREEQSRTAKVMEPVRDPMVLSDSTVDAVMNSLATAPTINNFFGTPLARPYYTPTLWLKVEIKIDEFAASIGLPPGIVTSLMRDLYNEGIIGEESKAEIGVTELGKLAYETVGEEGIARIISDSPPNSGAGVSPPAPAEECLDDLA
jgi:hypothetical protein